MRIHCGNCKTLLTGNFISNEKTLKSYYEIQTGSEIYSTNKYHFYDEVAGEMLSRKTEKLNKDIEMLLPHPSQVFNFLDNLDL